MNSFYDRAIVAGYGEHSSRGVALRILFLFLLSLLGNLLVGDNTVLDYLKDIPVAAAATFLFLPRSWSDKPVFFSFFTVSIIGFMLATYIT